MIDHRTGDPLQLWKWPAIVLMAVWSAPLGEPAEALGIALGTIVGAAIAFLIGTYIYRKITSEPGMPWWVFATISTLAGLGSFVGVVVGSVFSVFVSIYLVLFVLAALAYRGAGALGLRERVANQQT